ncbi:hypothetical protein SS1G_05221 [Sclerotinia sclerotiorum 1980 UF-70]|uniref:HNH nuclease domain-containing protein n=2 Tax=Sclerotinia sclerotiorum (strain ATCC 18683 / 1980 / Ss-1) TaxID=665079 RepID=A7EIS8_SCLS1|nr:hypothetical protein SS1G_05221 [Sclerotinia sclerotiorum 1980 UF-70]APA11736.1 hypothetical protein sscle_08g065060 [Sclerotinia sclerotiorum 1980 UF-70]EDO02744.1 hypothetical protein SS1G_05221 [Sclerotinia sclerotiorum 1980 UF-70]
MATSHRNTVPDRTKEANNKNKRKGNMSGSSREYPDDVDDLRIALKEMNEEEKEITLDTPPDTPISEIYARKRAWHRRKTLYLDMIVEAFSKRHRKTDPINPTGSTNPTDPAHPTDPTNDEKKNVFGLAERAHVELILQLYIKKRSSTEQSGFRDNLMDYYGVSRTRDGVKECWCVVSHSWGASKLLTAAHIMPVRLRQLPMKHIFGQEAAEELFSAKNGLILEKQIEKHFDNCQLPIVPCLSEEDVWELRVIDKHLLNQSHYFTSENFKFLHGRKLKFLNANRPRKRYLYYHWLMCITVAAQKKMNLKRIEEKARFAQYWGTPGRYLREEMIAAMMSYACHQSPTGKLILGKEEGENEDVDGDGGGDGDEDGNENEDGDEEDQEDEEDEEENYGR